MRGAGAFRATAATRGAAAHLIRGAASQVRIMSIRARVARRVAVKKKPLPRKSARFERARLEGTLL